MFAYVEDAPVRTIRETARFIHGGYELLRCLDGPLLADEIPEATGDASSSRATARAIGVTALAGRTFHATRSSRGCAERVATPVP